MKNNLAGNYLNIRLVGCSSNREGRGARITAKISGKKVYQYYVDGPNTDLENNTSIFHYGLGAATSADSITVYWPSGIVTRLGSTPGNTLLTINENQSAASVSISANPGNTICAGTNVIFTATPTNGGTPTYQWKVNGANVGSNSATYSSTSLTNSSVVTCVMTSSLPCAIPNPATSNAITMVVNAAVIPAVSIAANPGNSICSGTAVTFTATPTNGGTPTYQWKLNGGNVGNNSATYSNSSLANNNIVSCSMTSSLACASPNPATSNGITMSVTTTLPVSIAVISNNRDTICSGTAVTFTALPVNGGGTPAYQWELNSTNVGTNTSTYSSATLANGDKVNCVLTSSATCVSGNPATSNTHTITVNTPAAQPSAIVESGGNAKVCPGDVRTYSVTAVAGVTYNWVAPTGAGITSGQGTNSITLSFNAGFTAATGTLTVTPNNACGTGTARTLTIYRNNPAQPSVITITGGTSKVCPGDVRTCTVTAVSGVTFTWVAFTGGKITSGQGTNSITIAFTDSFIATSTLSVTASNGTACGISAARTTSFSRNNPAQPSVITITGGTSKVCPGDVRTCTVTAVSGITFTWVAFTGAKITSGQGTNSITLAFNDSFVATSTLSVTASYGNACGISAARTTSFSRNNPAQPGTITITGGTTKVCPGETRTCSVILVAGITYNWVAPTGINITSGQGTNSINISVTSGFTAASGTVSVTASYGTTCGISAPRTTTIYRNNPGQPSLITVTGGTTTKICPGDARTCTVTLVTGINYIWLPFTGDSITAGQGSNSINMAITKAFTATTGSLSVTANNACGTSSARAVTFTRNSPTEPGVITGATSVCANSTQPYSITAVANANSYVWGVPTGSTIQSGQGTTAISNKFGSTAGNIAVKSTNGCGASAVRTLAVAITCREDGEEIVPSGDFTIYPNPVSWQLTVSSLQLAGSKLIVTDMLGRVYLDEKISDDLNSKTLDVSNLASGVYFVTMKTEMGSVVRKFVKQ